MILYVYDDESIYWIHPKAVKQFCEENKLFRFTDKEHITKIPFNNSTESSKELIYSFPVTMLERILK